MGVVETGIDGVVVEGEPGAGGLLAQDTEIEVMIVMTINTVRTIFFIVIRVTPLIMITFILDQLKLYIIPDSGVANLSNSGPIHKQRF